MLVVGVAAFLSLVFGIWCFIRIRRTDQEGGPVKSKGPSSKASPSSPVLLVAAAYLSQKATVGVDDLSHTSASSSDCSSVVIGSVANPYDVPITAATRTPPPAAAAPAALLLGSSLINASADNHIIGAAAEMLTGGGSLSVSDDVDYMLPMPPPPG